MKVFLELYSWKKILLISLHLVWGSHQLELQSKHKIMSRLWIFSDLSQELYRLSDSIFSERLIKIGYLHGSRYQDDESLKVVDQNTGLLLPSMIKVLVYLRPFVAINMKEVKLVVENEDWGIRVFYLFFESMLLLQHLLESWIIVFDIADRLGKIDLEIIIVLVLENSRLWYIWVFN